jgi:hypothetical protein
MRNASWRKSTNALPMDSSLTARERTAIHETYLKLRKVVRAVENEDIDAYAEDENYQEGADVLEQVGGIDNVSSSFVTLMCYIHIDIW